MKDVMRGLLITAVQPIDGVRRVSWSGKEKVPLGEAVENSISSVLWFARYFRRLEKRAGGLRAPA
jgi:hypothetical protein